MSTTPAPDGAPLKTRLLRGALVNFLGVIGRAAGVPLQFVILTRLYGRAPVGLFFVAFSAVQLVGVLATWGLVDGAMLYASRHLDEAGGRARFYSYLRKVYLYLIVCGGGVTVLLILAAPMIGETFYPHYEGFVPTLCAMSLFIPLNALTQATVSVAKARLVMGHDALVNGVVVPLTIILFGVMFYAVGPREVGIPLAYVAGALVGLVVALVLVSRLVPLGTILFGRFEPVPTPGIAAFAGPQGLNVALSQFISSADVLMLAYFGINEATVAYYAIGSQIVAQVAQIKRVFSGSYSPIIARHYYERQYGQLNESFRMVTGWTISLAIPVLFIVAFFRHELLILFSPDFSGRPDFMLLLLINPFVGCAIGMMGNALVMAGFSRWNLFNSLTAGLLNFVLNLLLIPTMGIWGAALGTVIASVCVSTMQLFEARHLVQLAVPWRAILPWVGLGVGLFGAPLLLLPADVHVAVKILVALPALALYAAIWGRHGRGPARLAAPADADVPSAADPLNGDGSG